MPKKIEVEEDDSKEFFVILSSLVLFLLLIILVPKIDIKQECGDGTPYSSCSQTKPYSCDSGLLVENASVCGCENISEVNGDSCENSLQINLKEIRLNYILDGEQNELNFTVYGGLAQNLSKTSRAISYEKGNEPNRSDFIFKKINESWQREFLLPLVIQIQNLTQNKNDQAKVAISIVQNIPYGASNKTDTFLGKKVNYSRYPYEVLYDQQGICGEKSELLAFLLKEIGYDTVIFYNQKENHEAVGIKCPKDHSYQKTGYCFIETTGPAIISDDSVTYLGGITLESEPEVIIISEGKSLPRGLKEYLDANEMKSIKTDRIVPFRAYRLERLKQKYGLIEEYQIA